MRQLLQHKRIIVDAENVCYVDARTGAQERRMEIDYTFYAKEIISEMVSRILDTNLVEKSISYSELANDIKFPEPYQGSLFSGNIGRTLGVVGELLESVKIKDWNQPIPILQSMIISKTTGLPSYGLRAFVPGYDNLPKNEQKAFVIAEHEKILNFGNKWLEVLQALNIKLSSKVTTSKKQKQYNPFGSEGSPEHRKVKEYIKEKHHLLGYRGKAEAIDEYPLLSGDKIDVVFRDDDTIYAYEAKSIRSSLDDIQRGIFQCVKYKNVIEAETKVGARETKKVICALVIERELPKNLQKYCEQLGIKHYVVKVNIT